MEQLPVDTDSLIDILDGVYPLYNPKPTDSIEMIQRKAGQRDVVDWLLSFRNREQGGDE